LILAGGCPEMSVKNYHYTLRNFPEECRHQMYRMFHIKRVKLQDLFIKIFLSKKPLCCYKHFNVSGQCKILYSISSCKLPSCLLPHLANTTPW